MIDQHLTLVRNKCVDLDNYESDTLATITETLASVVLNLSHKSMVYASLVAMIAQSNPSLAQDIVEVVVEQGVNSMLLVH
mmetsp:Transcript_1968/g.3452  ORF Transcript_1968/g.3452 Transcript_1968/m.3452 type:complete len:80 (-) Transcript_1968:2315-2554(-)